MRAESLFLDFDPSHGTEQKGRRPALVIAKKKHLIKPVDISSFSIRYKWEESA
jgi:hypothetical protein